VKARPAGDGGLSEALLDRVRHRGDRRPYAVVTVYLDLGLVDRHRS